jgi:ketosteroid isomerase-like protein
MKTLTWLFVLGSAVVMSGCVTVSASDDAPAAKASSSALSEVEALERERFKAWLAADAAAIRPMLADDVVYCHSTGVCQNKEEIIEFVTSGKQRYLSMDIVSLKPREVAGAVVINGKLSMRVDTGGKMETFQGIYTDVYAKRNGRWQLVSWQSTRLP